MKRTIIVYATLALLGFGCSKGGGTKEEQLAALQQKHAELEQKITALQTELAAEGKTTAAAPERVEHVSVLNPGKKEFNHYVEVQGKIDADQNVNVSTKVPGVLTSIRVNRGDKVSKGQLLATLDDAAVASSLSEVQTQLDLATTVYEKQKRLWDQKVGTEISFLQAKSNKEALERRLQSVQEQVAMYRITSPISGTVDDVMPKVGELVSPGVPVVRVVNLNDTKLVAEVSEAYANRIKEGDELLVQLPDINAEFKSKVRVVSKTINPVNRTFSIEAKIPENIPVRPNLVAIIKINDYTNPSAISLPINLVQKDDRGAFVYVAAQESGKFVARKKPITVGRTSEGQVEVLSGLELTDRVINSGYQQMNEGQVVSFEQKKQALTPANQPKS